MQTLSLTGTVDDAMAQRVADAMSFMDPALPIEVLIDSDGGSCQAATSIFNRLTAWPGGCDTAVIGWALSAASMILMSGRNRRAHANSVVMIHSPWTTPGSANAPQLREHAETLDTVARAMQTAYARSGQSAAVVAGWFDGRDHFFAADEALALGLVTEVIPAAAPAMAFSGFAARAQSLPDRFRSLNMTTTTTTTAGDQAAIRAEGIRAEAQRRSDVQRHFTAYASREGVAALQSQCENDPTCTPEAAGLKLLAHLGAQSSPIMGSSGFRLRESSDRLGDFKAAAVDALLQRAGLKVATPHPAARDLGRMDLAAMAETILSMTGRTPRATGRDAVISASLSVSDFTNLLGNTASRALAIGYQEAAAGHALISSERELSTFREATLANLSEAPGLLAVPEFAEYQHGRLADSGQPFKVDPYGRVLTLSRQAIVNDDLAGFTRLPAAMGQAARRLEADLVFGLLNANPTMADGFALFSAEHGNLMAGAPLSAGSLSIARAAMRKQKGLLNEGWIDLQPAVLVVPVGLQTAAEQLVASMVDPAATNDTPMPAFVRRLTVVADPRLDEASTTAWYLTAAPTQADGLVRVYLAGQERPYLEEQAEFIRDCLSWKVRMDYGAAVMDHRPLIKNPGV